MSTIFYRLLFVSFILCLTGCRQSTTPTDSDITADANATYETKALFHNLRTNSSKGILFGQQDATAYGVGWKDEDLKSDVNEVCGSFPAVYGWDVSGIGGEYNIDSVRFDRIKFWIKSAFERGGVNTVSWHLQNPATDSSCWDTTMAVRHILPGGKFHNKYNRQLDLLVDFFSQLKSKNGKLIPVVFRPFHEANGHWFWWGSGSCTDVEYIQLFRYTVSYLRDVKGVHNLLYAYSPDIFKTKENYLKRFPGEEYVDVLGFDNYFDFKTKDKVQEGIDQLRIVVELAKSMKKVSALTETGLNAQTDSTWWTKNLLYPIVNDSVAKNIAWILVWRNADPKHFFVPYPGQSAVQDFIKFENDPFTIFERDLPKMYQFEK